MNKKILSLIILSFAINILSFAQPLHINGWDKILKEKQYQQNNFYPLYYSEYTHDSLPNIIEPLKFMDHNYSLVQRSNTKNKLLIVPEIDLYGGIDFLHTDLAQTSAAGIHITTTLGHKIAFDGSFKYACSNVFQFEKDFIDTHRIKPEASIVTQRNNLYYFYKSHFYLAWQPSKHFIFEGGFNNHHIGQGYRSLFLSNRNYNYPYFKITTQIWHLRYTALWIQLKDIQNNSITKWNDFPTKYTALHYLNWKVNKHWRVGFFEALIWQAEDAQGIRGFEINYLNPIIFFRPVEFTLGSPDNAMMGMDISFSNNNTLLYFQLLLDEFKISEVTAMNGWWANKQSFQIGWKQYEIFNVKEANSQMEINFIRPFMYAHFSTYQSYGHYNQPLAHPIGANVVEGVYRINYRNKRWNLLFHNTLAYYGTDPEGENYGGDIFKNYNTRTQDYNNKVGQGLTNLLLTNTFRVNYLIDPVSNLQLFSEMGSRLHYVEKESQHYLLFKLGITTSLNNNILDY